MSDEPEVGPAGGDDDETTGHECEGECCGTCGSGACACGACGLDEMDLAVISLCTGAASIFLPMGGGWLPLLGLVCAVTALVCGYKSLQAEHKREKAAERGLLCGAVGLVFWLLRASGPGCAAAILRHLW